jgi:hypothetical protein
MCLERRYRVLVASPRMRVSEREPEDEALRVSARPPASVAPMPAAVLRMQAAAGNRATSDMLARDAVKAKPKAAYTMTVGKMGDFPLLALMLPNNDRDDIRVTLSMSDGSKFQGPGLTATYPTITIKGAITITLTDVVIAGYTISGGTLGEEPIVEIALNAAKREIK